MLTPEQIARCIHDIQADARAWNLGAPHAETPVPVSTQEGTGMWQRFERGWAYADGRFINQHGPVFGTIHETWAAQRWEMGPLGYPIGGERNLSCPDPRDRWQMFQGGCVLWQASTNTTRVFPGPQGDQPSTAPTFRGRGLTVGIGVPDLQCWFDSGRGVNSFADGRASIWLDLARPPSTFASNGFEIRREASTVHSEFWPSVAGIGGRQAIRFGIDGRRTGLPFQFDLSSTAYTLFAVVRRESDKGDNHFLFTEGRDCGIIGCATNSSLHLGWQGNGTFRFGQYNNDLDMPVPDFRNTPVTAVVGVRAGAAGKLLTVDQPGFSDFRTNGNVEQLRTGGTTFFGCRATDHGGPEFWYQGAVFETLIFNAALDDSDYNRMKNALKAKFGVV